MASRNKKSKTASLKERGWRAFVVLLWGFAIHRLFLSPPSTEPDQTDGHYESLTELAAQYRERGCPSIPFTSIRTLSRSPKMILIEQFLTPAEAAAMVQIADPFLRASTVGAKHAHNTNTRLSESAFLKAPPESNRTDEETIIHCIEARAAAFQGYIPIDNMETLQVVKYEQNGLFRMHFDWLPSTTPSMSFAGNRLSSFFVYLHADCEGGNTVFPGIPRPPAAELCDALQCADEAGRDVEAVEIRPKTGRAVFWWNLDLEGVGDEKTLHAGMPVVNGSKIGMNIWTRERSWRSKVKLMD